MSDDLDKEAAGIKLNQALLSIPFKVRTNWHVITGAQSFGKTTLINQLADAGFCTVPKSARQYFDREIARGRRIEEILEDHGTLQPHLFDLQWSIECGLPATDVLFLDRALPDCLSFYRAFGLDPNEILGQCFHHRYASVLILDRLPIQRDGVRIEDRALAGFLDAWLAGDYSSLGYCVLRVPALPPPERRAFVLDWLSAQGLL